MSYPNAAPWPTNSGCLSLPTIRSCTRCRTRLTTQGASERHSSTSRKHTRIYIYMYAYVSIYMCMYVSMYVCMHACMYVCMCVYTHICMPNSWQRRDSGPWQGAGPPAARSGSGPPWPRRGPCASAALPRRLQDHRVVTNIQGALV